LDLKVVKVKAHSNNSFNNKADELAKHKLNLAPINLQIHAVDHSLLTPIWNLIGTIETNQCKWMKKVIQSKIFNSFIFNSNLLSFRNNFSSTDINWEYISKWISHNYNAEEVTSLKYTKQVLAKLKSLTNYLPTGDFQQRNYPKLYGNTL
jgi:hypothetical protein